MKNKSTPFEARQILRTALLYRPPYTNPCLRKLPREFLPISELRSWPYYCSQPGLAYEIFDVIRGHSRLDFQLVDFNVTSAYDDTVMQALMQGTIDLALDLSTVTLERLDNVTFTSGVLQFRSAYVMKKVYRPLIGNVLTGYQGLLQLIFLTGICSLCSMVIRKSSQVGRSTHHGSGGLFKCFVLTSLIAMLFAAYFCSLLSLLKALVRGFVMAHLIYDERLPVRGFKDLLTQIQTHHLHLVVDHPLSTHLRYISTSVNDVLQPAVTFNASRDAMVLLYRPTIDLLREVGVFWFVTQIQTHQPHLVVDHPLSTHLRYISTSVNDVLQPAVTFNASRAAMVLLYRPTIELLREVGVFWFVTQIQTHHLHLVVDHPLSTHLRYISTSVNDVLQPAVPFNASRAAKVLLYRPTIELLREVEYAPAQRPLIFPTSAISAQIYLDGWSTVPTLDFYEDRSPFRGQVLTKAFMCRKGMPGLDEFSDMIRTAQQAGIVQKIFRSYQGSRKKVDNSVTGMIYGQLALVGFSSLMAMYASFSLGSLVALFAEFYVSRHHTNVVMTVDGLAGLAAEAFVRLTAAVNYCVLQL